MANPETGKRIRDARLAAELTQVQLCSLARMSQQHLSDIERGARGASPDLQARLAKALRVPADELFADEPKEPVGGAA